MCNLHLITLQATLLVCERESVCVFGGGGGCCWEHVKVKVRKIHFSYGGKLNMYETVKI
jgi:hypothetical protein